MRRLKTTTLSSALLLSALFAAITPVAAQSGDKTFTIAVIPDTQNYIDYTHQEDQGFPLNGKDLFIEQMQFIAANLRSQGGDIDFVTSVGDVWQHQPLDIDRKSVARGYKVVPNPVLSSAGLGADANYKLETITAIEGYRLLEGKVPFSVAPGNHDFDAMWGTGPAKNAGPSGPNDPPLTQFTPMAEVARKAGSLMAGGLDNFRSVFGAESSFFKGKSWYVASHDGGGDSAQIFAAGGYKFLHIALQFDPPNSSLEWASGIIRQHPGLPTIVTTHDYLDTTGERRANPAIDLSVNDPEANNPQMLWDKFISQNDQIFMVICGHQHAQAFRADDNRYGHKVYQILSDYQDRQHLLEGKTVRKNTVAGLGDGWLRLMTFDMSQPTPVVRVRTYSSYFKSHSLDTPGYASWYRKTEDPHLTDEQFMREDDFKVDLHDFRQRFGVGSLN